MKLKNLNKEKYGHNWEYLFWELTNSKSYIFVISSIDFSKKFIYKNREVSFKKIVNKESFYYEIFIDNEIIGTKFFQQLELNAVNRMRSTSNLTFWSMIFFPFFIFILGVNLFYWLKAKIKYKKSSKVL